MRNESDETKIYNLKLLERYPPSTVETIIRVPGGWIYSNIYGCCFVPWDNEFQPQQTAEELQAEVDKFMP